MALDEPNEKDTVHHEADFDIIIEDRLLSQMGGISIDFRESRWMGQQFLIEPTYKQAGACC